MARASHKTFGLLTLALGALLGGLITAPAVQADDSPTVCATGCDYHTIQSAIDDASPGATIRVGAGTYTEKLTIRKSLSLIGLGQSTEHEVTSSAPTIDGGLSTDSSSPATITVNTDATSPTPPTIKVTIHNFNIVNGGSGIDVLQNAVMTVDKNTISGYSKNGITFGPYHLDGFGGVSGTISNNIIIGSGPNGVVAQNGIQIGETNTANVVNNQVSGHVYTGAGGWWATGIAFFSDGSSISNNTVNANQAGIDITDGSHNIVSENIINSDSSSQAGVMVTKSIHDDVSSPATANTINHNTITGGFTGIWTSYTCGNTYSNNTISNSTDNGIYSWDSDSNKFSGNHVSGIHALTNNAWGIALDGGDTSGTIGSDSNTVSKNIVKTSDVGIWVGDGSDNNTFTDNTLSGNSTGTQVDNFGGGAPIGLQFHFNNFAANVLSFTNSTAVVTDATNNWWGNASGPGNITYVTTSPWCTNISCEKKSNKGDSENSSHSDGKSAPAQKPSSEQKPSKSIHAGGVER